MSIPQEYYTRTMRCNFGKERSISVKSKYLHVTVVLCISFLSLRNLLWGFRSLEPDFVPVPGAVSVPAAVSAVAVAIPKPIIYNASKSRKCTWNSTCPSCEKEVQTTQHEVQRSRPADVTKMRFKRVHEAEQIGAYIVQEMNKMGGAPVSLMFGSVLHECRNGTGNCVEYNIRDKDLDLVVLPEDFPKIYGLLDDIKLKFGWKVFFRRDERLILSLGPHDFGNFYKVKESRFQIDIYSFHRDPPKEGLLQFPWDKVSFEMDIFLPLVKYKSVASKLSAIESENNTSNSVRASDALVQDYYYMPANVPCLLAKMYGDDFMTPKSGIQGSGTHKLEGVFRKSSWCKQVDAEDDK